MSDSPSNPSRRHFLEIAPATLAVGAMAAYGQTKQEVEKGEHSNSASLPLGKQNAALHDANPDSEAPPPTDHGSLPSFKYPFSLARKRVQPGGWTRQVTVRDLGISKTLAGVQMRLVAGGIRELHWHSAAEWAIMLYGNARITCIDPDGRSFVDDVHEGDLWNFPTGYPHSVQGLGPDGCEFLLVFDDGAFDEYETVLLTDWMAHTPPEVLARNFGVPGRRISSAASRGALYLSGNNARPSGCGPEGGCRFTRRFAAILRLSPYADAAKQKSRRRRGAHRRLTQLSSVAHHRCCPCGAASRGAARNALAPQRR